MHLDTTLTFKPDFRTNDAFASLEEKNTLPVDVWKIITTNLSAIDLQTCTLLNKNWRIFTVQMIGFLEFENIKKITCHIFKDERERNFIQKSLYNNYPIPANLIQIKKAVHFQIDCLLKNSRDMESIKVENFRKSFFYGNFSEILTVEKEFKSKRFPNLSESEKWINTLIENRYVSKVANIANATIKIRDEAFKNPFQDIILNLFKAGYEKDAIRLSSVFITSGGFYTNMIEGLIAKGMMDQAIQIYSLREDKALLGTLVQALIANKRVQEIPALLDLVAKESISSTISALRELIEAGLETLVIQQFQKMTNKNAIEILNDGLLNILIKNNHEDFLVQLLESKEITLDDIDLYDVNFDKHLMIYQKMSEQGKGLKQSYTFLKEKISLVLNTIGPDATVLRTLAFQNQNPFIKKIFQNYGKRQLEMKNVEVALHLINEWSPNMIHSLIKNLEGLVSGNAMERIVKIIPLIFTQIQDTNTLLDISEPVARAFGFEGKMLNAMHIYNQLPQQHRPIWKAALHSYYKLVRCS